MESQDMTNEVRASDNDMYTTHERMVKDKILNVRLSLIDAMTAEGVNNLGNERVRVLNEVLAATTKDIDDNAKNRLKYTQNETQKEHTSVIANMFIAMQNKEQSKQPVLEEIDVGDLYIPTDVVPGETSVGHELITMQDIFPNEDKS